MSGEEWVEDTRTLKPVYRLPKPLPPEPPVGSTVVDFGASHWTRQATDDPKPWLCILDGPGGGMPGDRLSWAELLAYGPVRLLGPLIGGAP